MTLIWANLQRRFVQGWSAVVCQSDCHSQHLFASKYIKVDRTFTLGIANKNAICVIALVITMVRHIHTHIFCCYIIKCCNFIPKKEKAIMKQELS